jgi:long-chain acyl-CoA synthetase
MVVPTIPELIDRSIERYGEQPAVRNTSPIPGEPIEITYQQLGTLSRELAAGLQREGVKPGDRVLLIAKPRIRFAIAVLGALRAGAWVVPVDPSYTAEEIATIAEHAEPTLALSTNDLWDRLPAGIPSFDLDDVRTPRFSTLLGSEPESLPALDSEDIAFLAYTSGTTGDPKGVMLSHGNVASDLIHGTKVIPVFPDDAFLGIAPWHHILGLVACLILPLYGGAVAMYTDDYRRIAALMLEHRVSIFVGVPKLYHALFQRLKDRVRSRISGRILWRVAPRLVGHGIKKKLTGGRLRFFVSGSAPLDPEVALGLRRLGIGMMEGYGLTETSPVVSVCDPFSRKAGSVGCPLPTVEARVDQPWPDGVGELFVRGPIVMQGYYRNGEATAAVLDEEGWFRTGDLALLDPQGEIHLKGRAKNVIVLDSGKNVYPEELEWEIARIPYVEEVLVRYREEDGAIEAVVYPNQERLQEVGAIEHAREVIWGEIRSRLQRVAPYKRLRSIRQLVLASKPFPKTSTLDIKRHLVDGEGEAA